MKVISKIKSDIELDLKVNPAKADIGICNISKLDQTILMVRMIDNCHGPSLDFNVSLCDPKNRHEIFNSVLILNPRFCNNYGHILHDNMPELIWAEENDSYDVVFAPTSALLQEIIGLANLKFSKVRFVEDQVYSFKANEVCFKNASTYPDVEVSKTRRFKDLIEKNLPTASLKKNLIYYSRSRKDARNGRIMTTDNELKIITLLKDYAENNDLNFCIYNGQFDGKRMSTIDQINLFRSAKMVVGPHGSGISNIIWTDPRNNCRICEFTPGTERKFQSSGLFVKNYNFFYSELLDDIFEYFVVPFTGDSTDENVEIDIDNLISFLKEEKLNENEKVDNT